jgi:hypothetical protein
MRSSPVMSRYDFSLVSSGGTVGMFELDTAAEYRLGQVIWNTGG